MLTTIESAALYSHRQSEGVQPSLQGNKDEVPLFVGLRLLLDAGRKVRSRRAMAAASGVVRKEDGSPATEVELQIEKQLWNWLAAFGSNAVVVGEETGGELPQQGTAVSIDPIDGTWAFLSETETYSTTLALIHDGRTMMGMVSNPVTGEIAYAVAGGGARLIRLSLFGEPDEAYPLKAKESGERPTLINVHPNRHASDLLAVMYDAWKSDEVKMVRSPGGSPACALVEVARGHFTYVNLWSKRKAEAFDLAAAVLIVREAGGEVSDVNGRPIDALSHSGLFVAGLDPREMEKVGALLRDGLDESDSR